MIFDQQRLLADFWREVDRIADLVGETEAIREREREMNERLYQLYNLSTEERLLVERDCARRSLL